MTRTQFFHFFFHSLPRWLGYLLLALFVLALLDRFKPLISDTQAATTPIFDSSVVSVVIDSDWAGGPRECDVLAGISTTCVFMD